MMISESPEATASSTTYWIIGLSTSGSISFGCAFVAGKNRVPNPAAGNTALRTRFFIVSSLVYSYLVRTETRYVITAHVPKLCAGVNQLDARRRGKHTRAD